MIVEDEKKYFQFRDDLPSKYYMISEAVFTF